MKPRLAMSCQSFGYFRRWLRQHVLEQMRHAGLAAPLDAGEPTRYVMLVTFGLEASREQQYPKPVGLQRVFADAFNHRADVKRGSGGVAIGTGCAASGSQKQASGSKRTEWREVTTPLMVCRVKRRADFADYACCPAATARNATNVAFRGFVQAPVCSACSAKDGRRASLLCGRQFGVRTTLGDATCIHDQYAVGVDDVDSR